MGQIALDASRAEQALAGIVHLLPEWQLFFPATIMQKQSGVTS